ncbi:TIGR03619 family F420-dependent LLM class oxidoreductase [Dietzia psychralcaliphila]|uniref:TIGR03619 family F420-dependent LLM class oxidoreductase n=1 Tax=Dietzia psychralcaliphila TaxID=139021 RepID=UPI001C1E52D0|nr:TIGR03619 family F420-dependent LLM class oxidoreductase [Dietzia psychralcaliphila]
MKFAIEYVVDSAADGGSLARPEGLAEVARVAEELGFSALALPEHPAPSLKWLTHGGHETFDSLTALSFVAALTSRLQIMAHLLVVPYRNPFLAAKSLATLDRLSNGRLVVGAGSGYLGSEFRALGVDMEQRKVLFDEGIEVMRGVWSTNPFSYDGQTVTAKGVAAVPGPLTPGGPPIVVGGNSALARRRGARLNGWSPMLLPEGVAASTRTHALTTIAELAERITEVRRMAHEFGNTGPLLFNVATTHLEFPGSDGSAEEHRDHLGRLEEAGVDQFVVRPSHLGTGAAVDSLRSYAAVVGLN